VHHQPASGAVAEWAVIEYTQTPRWQCHLVAEDWLIRRTTDLCLVCMRDYSAQVTVLGSVCLSVCLSLCVCVSLSMSIKSCHSLFIYTTQLILYSIVHLAHLAQNLRRVGKNAGPILSRLWTKLSVVLKRCRRPLVVCDALTPLCNHISFRIDTGR